MNHVGINLDRLVSILEGAEELRRMRLYRKAKDLIPVPGPKAEVSEDLAPLAEILYEPPFPVAVHVDPVPILFSDPTPEPDRVRKMVAIARQICHQHIEYLDYLEKQLEHMG